MRSNRLFRVLALVVVSFMPCIPAIAQIADAEGDADIPCIDIASIDVRGDATMLTVTLMMSNRPYPPEYVIEGVDDPNAIRLCPWGLYRVPIDTDADGAPDVVLQTWFDGDGNPVIAGAPSLELDYDVAAGRITWTVLNEDLGLEELPATVMLQTATTIVPENEVQPLEPVDYEDVAPEGWQKFVVGADAAALIGLNGGIVHVTDPSSTVFRARVQVPPRAVRAPYPIAIESAPPIQPTSAIRPFGRPARFLPEGLTFHLPVRLGLPFEDYELPPDPSNEKIAYGITQYDPATERYSYTHESYVDKDGRLVSGSTTHFSWFSPYYNDVGPIGSDKDRVVWIGLKYACYNDSDRAHDDTWEALQQELIRRKVRYALVNVGLLNPDGSRDCADAEPGVANDANLPLLLEAMSLFRDEHQGKILAWVSGRIRSDLCPSGDPTDELIDLSDEDVRAQIAEESWELMALGFDGIALDLEPFDSVQAQSRTSSYLLTLSSVGKRIHGSPGYGEFLVHTAAPQINPEDGLCLWPLQSHRNVLNWGGADKITVNLYDYGPLVSSRQEYTQRVHDSVNLLAADLPEESVIPGLSGRESSPTHGPYEQVAAGAEGIRRSAARQRLAGAGLYALYDARDKEISEHEWCSFGSIFEDEYCAGAIFEDDFSDGIGEEWILYGSPAPRWLESYAGRQGIFDNNGDSWCDSGAVTREQFDLELPLTIESDVFVGEINPSGCWNTAVVGLSDGMQATGVCRGDDWHIVLYASLGYHGDACWATPPEDRRHGWLGFGYRGVDGAWHGLGRYRKADEFLGSWHALRITLDVDGIPRFYIDGNLYAEGDAPIDGSILSDTRVVLGTRSSGSAGKSYHDWVRLGRGGSGGGGPVAVSHWRFDQETGLRDSVGNRTGFPGGEPPATGHPEIVEGGIVGGAVHVSEGNYVRVPARWIPGTKSFTLTAFAKLNHFECQPSNAPILVTQGGDFGEGVYFGLGNGYFRLSLEPGAPGSSTGRTFSVDVEDQSEWHHYAVVVDREEDSVRMYLDGVGVYEAPANLDPQDSIDPTFDTLIGAYDYVTARNGCPRFASADMLIDELKIFESVLTENQVCAEAGPLCVRGPVAHWPLDGDARDVAGGGHHGVVVNAVPSEDRFGTPNGAFRFDGDGDYIDISDDIDHGTGEFTWSAWFREQDPPTYRAIMSKHEGKTWLNDGIHLYGSWSDTGVPGFQICDGDRNGHEECDTVIATGRYDDGNWHHIAGVRDGDSLKLYVDGVLAGAVASSGVDADDADGMKIGARGDLGVGCVGPGCNDNSFLGSIDDVRIYDRALTPQEISCLYAPGTDVDGDGWCGDR